MKQTYQRPTITVIPMEEEVMQNFTTPVGPGPSPGGGLAKPGYFDDEEPETDDTNMVGYSPWKE